MKPDQFKLALDGVVRDPRRHAFVPEITAIEAYKLLSVLQLSKRLLKEMPEIKAQVRNGDTAGLEHTIMLLNHICRCVFIKLGTLYPEITAALPMTTLPAEKVN